MTDDQARVRDDEPGEGAAGALTQQTEGLDAGYTSAIAGPDWDPELVEDARTSMGGEELEGEVERTTPPDTSSAILMPPPDAGGLSGAPATDATVSGRGIGSAEPGGPRPADPQAGTFTDDPSAEPASTRDLHPDVGGPFGNS